MEIRDESAITAECGGEVFHFCSEGCRDRFLSDAVCPLPRAAYDLIIVGGGPAALTAAVYAATLRLNAFLVARDLGGQAVDSTKIENHMGFDFITGPELTEKFQEQLIHSNYIDHLLTGVEKIEPVQEGFNVTTVQLKKYYARTVIVATGMTRRKLNVPGEEQFQRKGLFYGNIQDYSFVTGQDVAVMGGGNSALQIVENLHQVARTIHIVSDIGLTADPAVADRITKFKKVYRHDGYGVVEFAGSGTVSRVTIRKMAEEETLDIPVKGVFIAIGLKPNSHLVADIVELNDRGEIAVNSDCSTSCPGLFAAGDVTNAFGKRIVVACGEGAKAAMAARQYLLNLRKGREERLEVS